MSEDKSYMIITSWALIRIYSSLLNYIKATHSLHIPLGTNRINIFINLYEVLQPFENPEVEMFYLLLRATVNDEEQCFTKAITAFKLNEHRLPNKYMENILIGLIAYADKKLAKDEKWRIQLHELYTLKLNKKIWSDAKGLSYSSLYNAILNELQMGNIHYADKILLENIDAITPKIKTSTLHMCKAWINFFSKAFEAAHTELVFVETENLMIKYELRVLQCLIYLENAEWELLGNYLESFRQFMMYDKAIVDDVTSAQYNHFFKQISSIAKLHPEYKQAEKVKFLQSLDSSNQSYMRNWMITKINSMK